MDLARLAGVLSGSRFDRSRAIPEKTLACCFVLQVRAMAGGSSARGGAEIRAGAAADRSLSRPGAGDRSLRVGFVGAPVVLHRRMPRRITTRRLRAQGPGLGL